MTRCLGKEASAKARSWPQHQPTFHFAHQPRHLHCHPPQTARQRQCPLSVPPRGSTSPKCVDVSNPRLAAHDGHHPLPLQLKATNLDAWHSSHCTCTNPRPSWPHPRYLPNRVVCMSRFRFYKHPCLLAPISAQRANEGTDETVKETVDFGFPPTSKMPSLYGKAEGSLLFLSQGIEKIAWQSVVPEPEDTTNRKV